MSNTQAPIAADVQEEQADDASLAGSSLKSSLESLRSSIMAYQVENGRRYHALSAGKYILPNDDKEIERLDLQHELHFLTNRGKIALCPKAEGKGAKRVLDAGTGTGIWATDYADAFPDSKVIGVDLSPIQPSFVPPNCSFEVDDLEKEWTWTEPFDFIFARQMAGSFQSYPGFIKNAFDSLESGGYLEMQDLEFPLRCDDGTMTKDSALYKWTQGFVDAGVKMNRPIHNAPKYEQMFKEAGFVDVTVHKFAWPTNRWPKDKHLKEVGQWALANVEPNLEGLCSASFTRGLGWTHEQTVSFCKEVRKEIRNPRIHAYWPLYVVYGRKP